MSGFSGFAPLQLPTSVAGTLFKDPEVREGKKGFFLTGKLKVSGGGFLGFIAFDDLAVQVLSECHAGQAVCLSGFVKAGKPYPAKQTGELVGTLDLTVEHAIQIEHKDWQNVRSEKGTAPPRQAAQPRHTDENGDANGNIRDPEETRIIQKNGQEGFDDDIPF